MKSLSRCYVERMNEEANISRNTVHEQGEKIKSFNTGEISATYKNVFKNYPLQCKVKKH